jgi:hypothetical protein
MTNPTTSAQAPVSNIVYESAFIWTAKSTKAWCRMKASVLPMTIPMAVSAYWIYDCLNDVPPFDLATSKPSAISRKVGLPVSLLYASYAVKQGYRRVAACEASLSHHAGLSTSNIRTSGPVEKTKSHLCAIAKIVTRFKLVRSAARLHTYYCTIIGQVSMLQPTTLLNSGLKASIEYEVFSRATITQHHDGRLGETRRPHSGIPNAGSSHVLLLFLLSAVPASVRESADSCDWSRSRPAHRCDTEIWYPCRCCQHARLVSNGEAANSKRVEEGPILGHVSPRHYSS